MNEATMAPQPQGRPESLAGAWYGLAILVLATVYASVDRDILLLVTEPLKHALGLSDTQIGALNGIALSLIAGLATIPLGWLADRVDRRMLLAVSILVWSGFTAACGLARSFPQLFACSMGIAVGEATLGPISYAFIPDLFPRDKWIAANYVFFVTGVVGGAAGFVFSGETIGVIEAHQAAMPAGLAGLESWRLALLAVAVPGVLLAALVMLIRMRQRSDSAASDTGHGLIAYVRAHLRTFLGVFAGFGLAASASGTVGSWITVVLVRDFGETPASTGVRFGLVMAVASIAGVAASAMLVRHVRPRVGELTPLRVAQLGVIAATVLMPLYLVASTAIHVYAIVCLQVAATTCALSLSPTVLQFMAPRLLRGRIVAVGGLLYMLFLSLSPVVVGAVSDLIGRGPQGLLRAVVVVATPCYIGGLAFLRLAEKTLPATFAAVAGD